MSYRSLSNMDRDSVSAAKDKRARPTKLRVAPARMTTALVPDVALSEEELVAKLARPQEVEKP